MHFAREKVRDKSEGKLPDESWIFMSDKYSEKMRNFEILEVNNFTHESVLSSNRDMYVFYTCGVDL